MAVVTASKGAFLLKAYPGDFKTLLAFNFTAQPQSLAGFTIQCRPPGSAAYFLFNELQFQDPTQHAQIATEPANSTVNAPIQKYRWTHVPGQTHQGTTPATGAYVYTVTPRFFDGNGHMLPLDAAQSASVTVQVQPFAKGKLTLGFTRGYLQSEAFLHHFGNKAILSPAARPLQFDTRQRAGTAPDGTAFTFADEYAWTGATARVQISAMLDEVLADTSLSLDVFAYDFNEPDVVTAMLTLAGQGRVRMILDNASLHMGKAPETAFAALFNQQAKAPAQLVRGCFDRYSHDKIFIVKKNGAAVKVVTGSTNFSLTGLYVNANHVLVFNDAAVAAHYEQVFDESWQILSATKTPSAAAANTFAATALATQAYAPSEAGVPTMSITFSPHTAADVAKILGAIAGRINQEAATDGGSVLFAVMQLTGSNTPVYNALNAIHGKTTLFSYGISDAPAGTYLYAPGAKTGVLVTGKTGTVALPPPFDQLPLPPGHEIHDKFVVCGLNGKDPVVYCGSSNLATGGEQQNGDNLLQIHDADVATAFAIEALLLVDHYDFLDRYRVAKAATGAATAAANAPSSAKKPVTKKAAVAKKTSAQNAAKRTRKASR